MASGPPADGVTSGDRCIMLPGLPAPTPPPTTASPFTSEGAEPWGGEALVLSLLCGYQASSEAGMQALAGITL